MHYLARNILRRFIPACAGNATSINVCRGNLTVHPRVCGERSFTSFLTIGFSGSSPRVRGTPKIVWTNIQNLRFIPACAGNAHQPDRQRCLCPVHPRVCGERCAVLKINGVKTGSSPRVRGTRSSGTSCLGLYRFIPACAGNAIGHSLIIKQLPVHPRVCGERLLLPQHCMISPGSSPRVRGTPIATWLAVSGCRFIPACAGNA